MSKRPGDPGYPAGWCIHYRSPMGPKGENITTCEKGVPYASFREIGPGFHARQPCFLTSTGESKPDALPCKHLRLPTKKEITAHWEWAARRMDKFATVFLAILPWREARKSKNASDVIDCPVCGARKSLALTIFRNGHVHGRCATKDCVSWIE